WLVGLPSSVYGCPATMVRIPCCFTSSTIPRITRAIWGGSASKTVSGWAMIPLSESATPVRLNPTSSPRSGLFIRGGNRQEFAGVREVFERPPGRGLAYFEGSFAKVSFDDGFAVGPLFPDQLLLDVVQRQGR